MALNVLVDCTYPMGLISTKPMKLWVVWACTINLQPTVHQFNTSVKTWCFIPTNEPPPPAQPPPPHGMVTPYLPPVVITVRQIVS
eukprot:15331471-Ditylum_brightwellii.AAC.1